MSILNKDRCVTIGDPRTQEMLGRRITATDQQIDRLVYELYRLTAVEIKIIESSERS